MLDTGLQVSTNKGAREKMAQGSAAQQAQRTHHENDAAALVHAHARVGYNVAVPELAQRAGLLEGRSQEGEERVKGA